jgi:zinc protease
MRMITSTKTATPPELQRPLAMNVPSQPGSFETANDVLGSLTSSSRFGRPWNYPETLKEQYEQLTLREINDAARAVVNPDQLIWILVGDRAKIEAGVASLGLGSLEVKSIGDL